VAEPLGRYNHDRHRRELERLVGAAQLDRLDLDRRLRTPRNLDSRQWRLATWRRRAVDLVDDHHDD
jgi:hypothetical protein